MLRQKSSTKRLEWAVFPGFTGDFAPFYRAAGRNSPVRHQQRSSRQHPIGSPRVNDFAPFLQTTVAGLLVAKQVLHHMEGVLGFGTDAGLGLFDSLHQLAPRRVRQGTTLARSHRHMPLHGPALVLLTLLNPLIARIAIDIGLLPM